MKTNSGVLGAVCLQQLLFHTSGRDPAALSLAERLGLGQLSWSWFLARGKARECEKKKRLGEGARERAWFGRAVCRGGDS